MISGNNAKAPIFAAKGVGKIKTKVKANGKTILIIPKEKKKNPCCTTHSIPPPLPSMRAKTLKHVRVDFYLAHMLENHVKHDPLMRATAK